MYIFYSLRRVNIVLIKSSYSLSLLRICYSVEASLSKVLKIPLKILLSVRVFIIYLVLVPSFLRYYFISLSYSIILRRSFFYS
jgi:hypothetical protein